MHFEHPAALWWLASAVVPFFVSRVRPPVRRIEIATLYLWRDAADTASVAVASRLARDWIAVLLQASALAALALAAAQPVVSAGSNRIALVFDTSPRMGTRIGESTSMDEARARAAAVLAARTGSSRVLVIAAGLAPDRVADTVAAAAGSMLGSIEPGSGRANLAAAVAAADAEGIARSNIFVFSSRAEDANRPTPSGVRWVQVPAAGQNVRLSRTVATVDARGGIDLLVEAVNEGTQPRDVGVALAIDGHASGRFAMRIAPGAAASHVERIPAWGSVAAVRIDGADALAADDVRFVALPARDRVRVAIAGRRHPYLEKAMASNPRVLVVVDPTAADVIVCDPCPKLPEPVGGVLSVGGGAPAFRAARLTLDRPDDPVVASIGQIDLVATPLAGSDTINTATVLASAGGVPAVIASEDGGRRTVQLSFDVEDPAASLSVAFPILVADAIDWLAARDDATNVDAGTPIVVRTRARSASATGPDGRSRPVRFQPGAAIVDDTRRPGAYTVKIAGGDRVFVANPQVDPATAPADALPPPPARSVAGGTPLTRALLLAALALVLGQWIYRARPIHAR